MNILITSVGTATSVGLIKKLKEMNHSVIGVDINLFGYTAGSMLVDYYQQIQYANEVGYIQTIKQLIEEKVVDLLIPINDVEIYVLSQCRDQIDCNILIPDVSIIELCRDKYFCNMKMKEIGINVPEMLNTDNRMIKRILRDRVGVGSKGIEVLKVGESVDSYNINEKFLQLFVNGEEYTVDVLADKNGHPIYIIPRKRIEVKSGVATKVKIEKQDKLIAEVNKIMSKYKLPGFSNMQFIKDEEGVFWFVEINNRFSGCGAATLATVPAYLEKFINIVNDKNIDGELNKDVKWNSVVTRYYEEVVYEENIS